jgi:hypothetical protein
MLSDCMLEICRGCCRCFDKGEEFCPFNNDDRNLLIEKMMMSDGVIFASPNYSLQVSAHMKKFLDRLGFVFHRPRFFGKAFTSIVTQGIFGGEKVVEYLDSVGSGLGFNVVKGSCITTLEPMTEEDQQKINSILAAQSKRFYERLSRPSYPVPSLFKLMLFRKARTNIRLMLNETNRDYRYCREQGWFESDYFYPTRLNLLKKAAGKLFDYTSSRSVKSSSVRI